MSTLGYLGVATLVLLLSVAAPAFAVVTSRVLRSDALTCNVVSSVAPTSNVAILNVPTPTAWAVHANSGEGPASGAVGATTAGATGSRIAGLNDVAIGGIALAPGIGS